MKATARDRADAALALALDRQAFDRGGPQLLNDTEHVAVTRSMRGVPLDRHDRRIAYAAIRRVCGGIAADRERTEKRER